MKDIVLLVVITVAVALFGATAAVQCPFFPIEPWTSKTLLPHEDCNKFYECRFGILIAYICPDNLFFDIETQQCDLLENVDCGDRNHAEKPENHKPELKENGCPVDPFIHWLSPSDVDCNVFYQCVWGQPVKRRCPATLHFNPVLQVCDYPNDAGCKKEH